MGFFQQEFLSPGCVIGDGVIEFVVGDDVELLRSVVLHHVVVEMVAP